MNSLYFTLKDRKSLKTLRLEYGQLGLKFVLRMFEGQIDRRGDREDLPKEILFEGEQEMLKQIHHHNTWNYAKYISVHGKSVVKRIILVYCCRLNHL